MVNAVLYYALLVLAPVVAVLSAGHALIYKRNPRSALGWIAVCLMFPLAGPLLYGLFGINRVRTRAQRMTQDSPFQLSVGYERGEYGAAPPVLAVPDLAEQWQPLARVSEGVGARPLLRGNRIEPLHNGEAAFPAMIAAIRSAQHRVWLTTYLFETNATGRAFIDALVEAHRRGVEVLVLLDGVGELYDWPPAGRLLRRAGVRVERFLPPRPWPPSIHINLRNHRKILAVDGREAFVGGMNIGDRHLAANVDNPGRVVDLHFRVRGPLVAEIATVFAEDWQFACDETLRPDPPPEPVEPVDAQVFSRALSDGPNENMGRLLTVLIGATNVARSSIDIMTPYCLPPSNLVSAIQCAVLRGVRVRLLLPGKNNLPYVHWANRNMLWELLQFGVEVYYQPPPFVHTKLFVVDRHYALIGSANLDSRSLRLNFELAVEAYGAAFAEALAAHCDDGVIRSRRVTLEEVDARSMPVRIRDAACWLFSPYL